MSALTSRHCTPCEGGTDPLDQDRIHALLGQLSHWEQVDQVWIQRRFKFDNYYETVAFFNAIAWVSHRENHHPDCTIGYRECLVRYTTHAIGGLSENDFICAAKVDALID